MRRPRPLVPLLALLLAAAPAAAQSSTDDEAADRRTPRPADEQFRRLVGHLTPTERAALDRWLGGRPAVRPARQAPGDEVPAAREGVGGFAIAPGRSGGLVIAGARPRAAQGVPAVLAVPAAESALEPVAPIAPPQPVRREAPRPAAASERPLRVLVSPDPSPPSLAIAAVVGGGDLLQLEDGTLYEPRIDDRARLAAWRRGQHVVLRPVPVPSARGPVVYDVLLVNGEDGSSVQARWAGRRAPAGP